MPISRISSIPRFALPYSISDFAAGFHSMFASVPPPDAFDYLGGGPSFWARSGRQALRVLLQALDLKPGSGVAVPLFTDPSLFHAIAAAGCRPVFVDIDPQFLTIDPRRLLSQSEEFSAVVAVHLFGQTAEMPAVLAAAGGVPVIEDTAHAPLSYLEGRMAGSFGWARFYSFASTKYWPAGGGGLAVLNDPSLAPRVEAAFRSLAAAPRWEEARGLLLQGAKSAVFHRRLYGLCGRPLRRWVEKWALLEPVLDQSAILRPCAAVARRQAPRMIERIERQRANSLRLLSRLFTVRDLALPWERPQAQHNYHLFPVLLRDREERDAIVQGMWGSFVDTSTIYSGVVREARRFGYDGGCPIAESVATRLITLPNYAGLTDDEIDYVAQTFFSCLSRHRGPHISPVRSAAINVDVLHS